MTLPPAVVTLIAARRIEQVPADRPSALVRLTRAEEKLEAARKIAAIRTRPRLPLWDPRRPPGAPAHR